MTVTYTDPTKSPLDAVRFLVGDTDVMDAALQDEEIDFALSQAGADTYLAAALCARSIAAKYASLVDTRFETVSSSNGQLSQNYYALAQKLEAQSKKYGTRGLGVPAAGGLTYSGIRANDLNYDRVEPKFKQDQFANPSGVFRHDEY